MAIMTEKQKKLEAVKKKRKKYLSHVEAEHQRNLIAEDLLMGMRTVETAKKHNVAPSRVSAIKRDVCINDNPPMSFIEIGKVLGVSNKTARIIHNQALKKMRIICIEMDIEFSDIIG